MKKLIVLTLLGSLISACGVTEKVTDAFGGDEDNATPPTPLREINTTARIIEKWSENTDGAGEQYLKLTPAISDSQVYVATNDGDVEALDAETGRTIWDIKLKKVEITGGPGAEGSLVLVGTSEAEVIALNKTDGSELWRKRVSSEVLATPVQEGDAIIVRTIDGKITSLNAEDGEKQWVYERTVPALTLRGTSAPVISDNTVICGFDSGRLVGLELNTGKLLWEAKITIPRGGSELERIVDIDSQPVVKDGFVYVTTYQGNVAALDIVSGEVIWRREISSYAGLAVEGGSVFVTDSDSVIWALDKYSGASIWQQDNLTARAATAPATLGDMIAVGDIEGYVHFLDKFTGDFVARKNMDDERILTQPIVKNEVLYMYSSSGILNAYTYEGAIEVPADQLVSTESLESHEKSIDTQTVEESEEEGSFFGNIFSIFGSDEVDDEFD